MLAAKKVYFILVVKFKYMINITNTVYNGYFIQPILQRIDI